MKHIILFLFVLLALISCVKEEEDSPLLSAPVITLKEESSIYKTKSLPFMKIPIRKRPLTGQ